MTQARPLSGSQEPENTRCRLRLWTLRPLAHLSRLALLAACVAGAPAHAKDVLIPLSASGFDMEIDLARDKLYVSLPSLNDVAFISLTTGAVENRIRFGPELRSKPDGLLVGTMPHGLDISLDGSTLFVALNGASSIVAVDLDSMALEQTVIGAELGDARTWDVIEGKQDRVFASANPGSSGFAYITLVKTDEGNAASRVAGQRIIRAAPVFAPSPDGSFLYVGEGFSPNSLYKLDITTDTAPIILEDNHGSVSGTNRLEVSPDGGRIYLGSGQVLRTSDFIQIGLVGSGIPRLNSDGSLAYVAKPDGVVDVYETVFFTQVGQVVLSCSFTTLRTFDLLDDGRGMLLLGDAQICGKVRELIFGDGFETGDTGFWSIVDP